MTVNCQKSTLDCLSGFGELKANVLDISRKLQACGDWYRWEFKDGGESNRLNVMFIGQTGVGKSSAINRIAGTSFLTSDIESCTKDVNSVDFQLSGNNYFCINDLPGIGESFEADKEYIKMYDEMVCFSDCVVYLISADRRDYQLDIKECNKIIRESYVNRSPNKLIIGLSAIDKIEPLPARSLHGQLSPSQEKSLRHRVEDISNIMGLENVLGMGNKFIVPFSAKDDINISLLTKTIFNVVWDNLYYNYKNGRGRS